MSYRGSKQMRVPPPIWDDVEDLKLLFLIDSKTGTNRVAAIRKAIADLKSEVQGTANA